MRLVGTFLAVVLMAIILAPLPVSASDLSYTLVVRNKASTQVKLEFQGPEGVTDGIIAPGGLWEKTVPIADSATPYNTEFDLVFFDVDKGAVQVLCTIQSEMTMFSCDCSDDEEDSKLIKASFKTQVDEYTARIFVDLNPR